MNEREQKAKAIVQTRNFEPSDLYMFKDIPGVGEYVITGMQAGNMKGERGWIYYIGYVVQIRKNAGAFGTHLLFLRHPDGTLSTHENQYFHKIHPDYLDDAKALFDEGVTPEEMEDYSEPYTIGGEFPETGKIIENPKPGRILDESPRAKITVTKSDGSKEITIV